MRQCELQLQAILQIPDGLIKFGEPIWLCYELRYRPFRCASFSYFVPTLSFWLVQQTPKPVQPILREVLGAAKVGFWQAPPEEPHLGLFGGFELTLAPRDPWEATLHKQTELSRKPPGFAIPMRKQPVFRQRLW